MLKRNDEYVPCTCVVSSAGGTAAAVVPTIIIIHINMTRSLLFSKVILAAKTEHKMFERGICRLSKIQICAGGLANVCVCNISLLKIIVFVSNAMPYIFLYFLIFVFNFSFSLFPPKPDSRPKPKLEKGQFLVRRNWDQIWARSVKWLQREGYFYHINICKMGIFVTLTKVCQLVHLFTKRRHHEVDR